MKKNLIIALSVLAIGLGAFGVKALADSAKHQGACCVPGAACCVSGAACCK
jgi:hypothetical protein